MYETAIEDHIKQINITFIVVISYSCSVRLPSHFLPKSTIQWDEADERGSSRSGIMRLGRV